MKSLFTFISFLVFVPTLGQIVKLEPSNPAPRVREGFTISFVLEKNDPDSLEVVDDWLAQSLISSMNRVADGNIEISDWLLTEEGHLQIGPLQIPVNGKTYITNTLDLIVTTQLPDDIDEGLWIRQLNFQGQEYIILEQRHPGKMKQTTNENGRAIWSITNDGKWAKVNMDKIQRKGIEIELRQSRSSIQSIDVGDAVYMQTIYTYKPLPSFKERLTIDKTLLDYVPEKGHFEVIQVGN